MRKMPKGLKYWYIDEKTEQWRIQDDAPVWAKQEFEEYIEDEEEYGSEIVTRY